MAQYDISTPVGPICLSTESGAITSLAWAHSGRTDPDTVLTDAAAQVQSYFAGDLQRFDLRLAPGGSDFQLRFYDALCAIPYGQTRTYGELAKDLGVSAQAIGQACGANPIAILIPCHRVLAADGLGGYSGDGGIETKVALLRLEGAAGLLI